MLITVTSDGELVGTQVMYKGVQFSASGDLKLSGFKAEGGKLTGKLATSGQATSIVRATDSPASVPGQSPALAKSCRMKSAPEGFASSPFRPASSKPMPQRE